MNLRLIIEYCFVYIIYKFLSFLPISFASNIGAIIFRIIGPLTIIQKTVLKNIILIFPSASKKQVNKCANKSWINIGKTFFELLVLPKIIQNKNRITIEGKNYLKDILNKKEKAIFVGIHQSNWEILLPSIDKLGIPVGGIYRHINNSYIDKLILNIRQKSILSKKSFYTPKGKKSAKDIIEGIKKDISIVLLVDQKDSAGEFINFFNFPSKTQIGFIKIARKHNMKIIPVQNIRHKNNTFTLKFHTPIEKISKKLSDNEVMKNIYVIIESWIKENPSQWFLQHNRFR